MTYQELLEVQKFRDFLKTLNAIKIFKLKGSDNNTEDNKNGKKEQ